MDSSWLKNICVKRSHNCLNGESCPPTSECCHEKGASVGTCVAKGSCNWKTGHPTQQASAPCPPENYREGYNDDDSCVHWKNACYMLALLIILVGIAFVICVFRK